MNGPRVISAATASRDSRTRAGEVGLNAARIVVLCSLMVAGPILLPAAPPPALASALENLRDQRSYSWEVINSDPGPIAHTVQTRRGTITRVQQNLSPHVKGSIDLKGYTLIQRDWSDGLRLDTLIAPDGTTVTNTPEGWLSNQEILTAQAEERIREDVQTPRAVWLRRADRPDDRRPDQELVPMLKSNAKFEQVATDTFVMRGRIGPGPSGKIDENDPQSALEVSVTIHIRAGVIRDYEVDIEGSRRVTRATVPVNDHRIVVVTYVAVSKVDAPAEAHEKLQLAKLPVH